MNKVTIEYDKMTLLLTFEGVEHSFDLEEGDAGDYWYGFQHHGLEKDLNFWTGECEGEYQIGVSIYGVVKQEDGNFTINTNDEVSISLENIIEKGDKEKYLKYWDRFQTS